VSSPSTSASLTDIFMRRVVFVSIVSLAGCAKTEQAPQLEQSRDSAPLAVTPKPQPAPVVFRTDSGSPRLVIDSATKEPRLELRDGEFVVHLPLDMARVLADSLPGFAPIKRSSFDTSLVGWRDRQAANPEPPPLDPADSDAIWAAALSVAVGDFDGDSKRDIAMEGISGELYASFFLLSASASRAQPALLYFRPPSSSAWVKAEKSVINYFTLVRPGKVSGFSEEEGDTPVLSLHHDAIDFGIFEKASELYYIENGVVQVFTTSD
jgi:hypothetical protein